MDLLLDGGRFLTYAAALQVFGVAVFQWIIVPRDLRIALNERAIALARIGAVLLLAGELIWHVATAGSMGDGWTSATDPQTLWLVLSQTAFGRVLGVSLLGAALLCGIVAALPGRWAILTVLSGFALCGIAMLGHATFGAGMAGLLNRASQAVHTLSSAFWLGSLIPLLFCLKLFRTHEADADRALRRFSGLGHFAVAALLLSGIANSWFVLDGAIDPESRYQQLLLIKMTIAGVMVCLAVVNRYVFVPRIPNGGPGLRQLAHGTIAEIVLGAGILGLVSVIGTMSPA